MNITYKSTRGAESGISASRAIIKGLSEDGGLFVPEQLPGFDFTMKELTDMDYRETAYRVMRLLLSDFSEQELRGCIEKAYDSKFDTPELAPLVKRGDRFFLELFHGKTIAFKDMALSILPHLLTCSMKKNGMKEKVVILTATSGDTGKAALAGFSDVEGTQIIVFYPKGGVSRIQELQMVTEKGKNTKVIGVNGNFDDCQTGVKEIFGNRVLKQKLKEKGYVFSSANSINIGRLIPQIAYYVWAYGGLLKSGEIKENDKVNFTVPTGNFGNILAAYYAKRMGLPVHKLICASNENNVLFDFFHTGIYDKNREFILTSSPSMDILISSNLERLIYHIAGDEPEKTRELMLSLANNGRYEISDVMKTGLSDFYSAYAKEEEVFETIRKIYEEDGYVIDTHTAVAACAAQKYRNEEEDPCKNVIVSTASPFKFAGSVVRAMGLKVSSDDDFVIAEKLSDTAKIDIPNAVREIRNADILHNTICDPSEMEEQVIQTL